MNDSHRPLTMINHYRVLSKIGEGGMGEVYLAHDTKLGRKVALKFLPPDVTANPDRLRRFEQEAQAASAFNHPNIITIHEIGTCDHTHFIVSEYVEGNTLRKRLDIAPFPIREVLEIATQVASALDIAHQSGITHRDIKPENIMVRADGLVKILDFGLAKLSEPTTEVEHDAPTRMILRTSPGIVMGTLTYMSPEQARGFEIDGRSDLFSFGIVLHEMLSGRSPFARDTQTDVIAAILMAEPPLPSSSNAQVPSELDRIVTKMLKKKREERYQTGAELLADLKLLKNRVQVEHEFAVTRPLKSDDVPQHRIRSLAILPFSNASDEADMEYLSDGLTDSVLFGLSQLPDIQVMARSAVFRHKNSGEDPLSIGKQLGVKAVVTGRVRHRGPTLMIMAELIDIDTGLQLWGAQYKRPAEELFDIEDEIADEISRKLRLTLLPEHHEAIDRRRTENTKAYHAYLKARFYWSKRTEDSLYKALELFRKAIDADPLYALAYAGLAEGYVPFAYYSHLRPDEAWPKARAAAEKALEIDPHLPEALTVIGCVKAVYDWDLAGAESVLREAVRLDPKYARARQTLSECLTVSGKFEEAVVEIKKAVELDPLSLHTNAARVMHNYYARRYTEAINQGRQTLDLDPNFFPTHFYLGLAYQAVGNHEQAVAELERARALSGGITFMTANLAAILVSAGSSDEADKLLAELEEISATRYVPQTPVAAAYALKGDIDEALSRLERAFDERCSMLPYAIVCDVMFDGLRSHARFRALADKMFRF